MYRTILSLLFVYSFSFAQVNENIFGNWHITNITIEGEILAPLNQNVTATLGFSSEGIHISYQAEPCFIANPNFTSENSFTLDFPNVEAACLMMPNDAEPYEPFQAFYHDFFPLDNFSSDFVPTESPIIYNYTILDFDGFSTLAITKENGDVLNAVMFENSDDDDLFETWVLSSVTYQDQTLTPSPEVEPATLLFDFIDGQFELNLNYCNECYFPIEFVSEEEFVVINNQMCTLMLCENEAFQPVLGIYQNGFWQNIGFDNPYTFVITDEGNISTLTITNSNGDVMIFNINFASNENFETPIVALYPNPVQNNLYFSSETSFKNYQIVDLTGKILQKGNLSVQSISVESLPNGLFFLQLENQNVKTTLKFVKE
jgi:hypothetical protein